MSVPSEATWRSWTFLRRLDWAAVEVSLQGRRLPNWALAFHFGRWVLQVIIFRIIITASPIVSDDSRESAWCNVVRFAIFCHVLESFGWRHGPMCGGRVTPWPFGWFTNAHYRLSRGTFRYTGNPLIRSLLGDRRTAVDVAGHVSFLLSAIPAVLMPQRFPWATVATAVCTVWIWVSDQPQSTDGKGTTYVHFILAGCVSAAHGGVACGQIQLLIIWMASGLCKVGPWMAYVNGPLMGGSIWCRGRAWIWRLLYRGEEDLRPTCASSFFSRHASHPEWICPLMLLLPSCPFMIYVGLAILVAMHAYIMATAGLDVHAWNGFFMIASLGMFGGPAAFGFDYIGLKAVPIPLLVWYAAEIVVIVYGWFYPGSVSFQAGHRNWAGNEPAAVILLRRDAAPKLTKACYTFGQPIWDPIPKELCSWYPAADAPHAAEISAFKIIAAYWLGLLSLKVLPALVEEALDGAEIKDFYVLNHFQFWDMLWGSYFFCPTHMPQILEGVQRLVSFTEGDCICITVNGFPVAGPSWGGAAWKIIDAKTGIVSSGEASLETALALATLPSACARARSLLGLHEKSVSATDTASNLIR